MLTNNHVHILEPLTLYTLSCILAHLILLVNPTNKFTHTLLLEKFLSKISSWGLARLHPEVLRGRPCRDCHLTFLPPGVPLANDPLLPGRTFPASHKLKTGDCPLSLLPGKITDPWFPGVRLSSVESRPSSRSATSEVPSSPSESELESSSCTSSVTLQRSRRRLANSSEIAAKRATYSSVISFAASN